MNRLVLRSFRLVGMSKKRPNLTPAVWTMSTRYLSEEKKAGIENEANQKIDSPESPKNEDDAAGKNVMKVDFDEYDDYYREPQTPKEKFKAYSSLFIRLGLLGLAAVCVYITAKELFPGRLNPISLFSEVFEKLRYNEQIMEMVGDEPRAFGRDVGRNTEGRRNHVDSYKYKAEDGKDRIRIRMNIKGSRGQVRVWAEVEEGSKDDEFVYLIVQNIGNGRVLTLVDRRDEIAAGLGASAGDDSIAKFFSLKK